MFRKNHFSFLTVVALFFGGTMFIFAQSSPVRGKVELKKADGTTEPVAGATVEVYRTDVKGKLPTGKTDKKGAFSFAGFPLGQVFALSISAPNITPAIYPNIRGGMENITITVVPGDGRKFTEDEARQSLAASPGTTAASTNVGGGKPAETTAADQKKAQAEQAKAVAEYESRKKNAEETFALVKKLSEEGVKAYKEKNYDLAVAKYSEGVAAQPDFEGSAPILLNLKAQALNDRAVATYNQSLKGDAATKLAALESAKKDFQSAVDASTRSIEILTKAPAGDAENQKKLMLSKMDAMRNRDESYRLMGRTGADRSKAKEALASFQEYMAVEQDAKLKFAAQLSLAQTLQDANDFDQAVVEFQKVLDVEPNNVDALAGIGLSLVTVGYTSNDKTKFQAAANYLQKFVDLAPDTNALKADAKATIESLKAEQSVAPQKGTKTTTKKKP